MKIHEYLLAIVFFSFFIVGILFVINDINGEYDNIINVNDDFNGTYNKVNETYDLSQNIKDDVLNNEISGGDQSWESMTKGSYTSARKSITGSFSIVISSLNDISRALGIPNFLLVFAITALVIVIIFSLIYLIFRY